MNGFADLGVPTRICDALAARGLTRPLPIQTAAIPDGLAGRDVCGKAKTGSGKTLAFGIPLVMRAAAGEPRRPGALILVPTRELASQVADELRPIGEALGRTVGVAYGGISLDHQSRELQKGLDVLVATPGRLIDLIERKAADLSNVAVVTVDEADRMADMGFLPQVQWVLRHVPRGIQTFLFSATLDGAVGALARGLSDPVRHEVADGTGQTVTTMAHRFLLVHQMDKARVAAAVSEGVDRMIVFCATKRGCDRVARDLRELGVGATAIHGDLRQRDREKALAAFAEGRRPVLVATDVAARGIHVDDVDCVLHWDPPATSKDYLHRSGRTARAGSVGLAVTLLLWNEELAARSLIRQLRLPDPIVEAMSNHPHLRDLAAWDPTPEDAVGWSPSRAG
jgi:superfamily II DNA/RNA helicase